MAFPGSPAKGSTQLGLSPGAQAPGGVPTGAAPVAGGFAAGTAPAAGGFTAGAAASGAGGAVLTPDDLERLATAFRPSWELDEAPFTGAGSLSPADIRALGGGGTHVDVRSAAFSPAHTSHAPAKPVIAEEPANKVIVDPGLVAPASVRPPPPPMSDRPHVLQ
ncbi:MAG: hypothetical protein ACRENE_08600 [Polyangiaceae bacterium]